MEPRAVDFVKYTVSDCSESIPFYRDTLGLTLENHVAEYGWAEFALPPTTLALEEVESDQDVDPAASRGRRHRSGRRRGGSRRVA